MTGPSRRQGKIKVTDNFELDLFRASGAHESFFVLGVSSDDDSGGWVMNEVEKNLCLCIVEKEKKIAPYRSKYAEW